MIALDKDTRGRPLPFTLKSIRIASGQLVRHAVVECCVCGDIGRFPHTDQRTNPSMICKRFERWGWEIYKSKARCPQHADQRRRQKAHFARLNEEAETMPELVKTP